MAVNGLQIRVGQMWETRNKMLVTIIGMSGLERWIWDTDRGLYSDNGMALSSGQMNLACLMNDASVADEPMCIHEWPAPPVDMTAPGYETLANVLQRAYNQAAVGKGIERHAAGGEPFHEQVMQIGAAKFGVGALLFQAFKKSEESQRLEHDRAVNELLGAINYLAGAVVALELKAGAHQ